MSADQTPTPGRDERVQCAIDYARGFAPGTTSPTSEALSVLADEVERLHVKAEAAQRNRDTIGQQFIEVCMERDEARAVISNVKLLLAKYEAWDGDRDSEYASSPLQREQLRAALLPDDGADL